MPSRPSHVIVDRNGSSSELRATFGTRTDAMANMHLAGALHHVVHDALRVTQVIRFKEYDLAWNRDRMRGVTRKYHGLHPACGKVLNRHQMMITEEWLKWTTTNMVTQTIVPMVMLARQFVQPGWANMGDVLYYAHFCRRPTIVYNAREEYERVAKRMKMYHEDAMHPTEKEPTPSRVEEDVINLC